MKDFVLNELPEIIKDDALSTLTKVSFDKSNNVSMVISELEVIDFDEISEKYSKRIHYPRVLCTNDALYVDEDYWYFIEFKNGKINKLNIHQKIYDSILMLIELDAISDLAEARTKIKYILVRNPAKDPITSVNGEDSLDKIYGATYELAKIKPTLYDIDRFNGYILKDASSYTPEEFIKSFVAIKEKEENLVV